MRLEDYFTVVYWDYRYMGIAYDRDADTSGITLDNLLDDTYAVTEYMKERFNKDKIAEWRNAHSSRYKRMKKAMEDSKFINESFSEINIEFINFFFKFHIHP